LINVVRLRWCGASPLSYIEFLRAAAVWNSVLQQGRKSTLKEEVTFSQQPHGKKIQCSEHLPRCDTPNYRRRSANILQYSKLCNSIKKLFSVLVCVCACVRARFNYRHSILF
jgi:hypothetical protein